MVRTIGRGAALLLCLGSVWSGEALAQSCASSTDCTRTSSFAYDPASGLLTQEVIEPNTQSLRLETDYVYDAFGNKTSATVSGVDITTRTSTSTFDAQGQFTTTNTNALNQSETWQYDPRFGKPTFHKGPNGLITTWTYDSFGRKTSEVRPDGTQTKWSYQFCSGINGGNASCPTGVAYLIVATPLASDGATQNGPLGVVYFDILDREVIRLTQGFDGSTIQVSKQYDSSGRVQQQSRPYFQGGTPQLTTFTYDALGRVVTATFPDSSTTQHAYHGLTTTETNALNQTRTVTKDSQGEVVSVTDAAGKTTTYAYDPFGKLTQTTDPLGNIVTATYDVRGRKTASSDPDLGAWSYAYDTANELVSQTDAKSQTSTFSYDKLGRMTGRAEPSMDSEWVYDTAPNGIGKIAYEAVTLAAPINYSWSRGFQYDSEGRAVDISTAVDGSAYTFMATYDGNSRLSTVTYPSGLVLSYAYTTLGYAQQITNATTGQAYWTANTRDAELHLTQQTAGNNVVTNQDFDLQTGRLMTILAGNGNIVENFSYMYDFLGNVTSREDANENNLTESFQYDVLNRLTQAQVSQNIAPLKTFAYDLIGNLLSKSDVGAYTYPASGAESVRPHAVTSISGSIINTTFAYDANGNQTAGLGRSISYTSFNKPSSITQGSGTLFFTYDADHQRSKQTAPEGYTYYFDAFGVHAELFLGATSQWNDYLMAGGAMIGMVALTSSSVTTRYFNTDNLGSIAVITDESGTVLERDSYDAWGQRRLPTGADGTPPASQTTRGFTGQEELDFGLVHLNGRVYDPLVGRMMSADPYVPDPLNGQAWNRYSYVINNPLTLTDPSGYSWLSTFLDHSFGVLFREFPILGTLFEIATVGLCTVLTGGGGTPVCAAAAFGSTTFVDGVSSGNLGYALRAGLIAGVTAGVTAGVFSGISEITNPMTEAFPPDTYGATELPDINVIASRPLPPSGLPTGNGIPGCCGGGDIAIEGSGGWGDGWPARIILPGLAAAAVNAGIGYQLASNRWMFPRQQLDLPLFEGGGGGGGGSLWSWFRSTRAIPELPTRMSGDKTMGLLSTVRGNMLLESGKLGPASAMPKGAPGFDAFTRTHVEGHAAAVMREEGIPDATLYINNPVICPNCSNLLPRMLPSGSRLTVVTPSGSSTFVGIEP